MRRQLTAIGLHLIEQCRGLFPIGILLACRYGHGVCDVVLLHPVSVHLLHKAECRPPIPCPLAAGDDCVVVLRLLPNACLVHPAPHRSSGIKVAILLDLAEEGRNGPTGLEAVDCCLVAIEHLVKDVGCIGIAIAKLGGHIVDIKANVDEIALSVATAGASSIMTPIVAVGIVRALSSIVSTPTASTAAAMLSTSMLKITATATATATRTAPSAAVSR